MEMNDGLGSPIFFYYPPIPFFVTSLLRPLFHNDALGWHQLGVSASVALIASGVCAYLWLTELVDRNSALAAAILYMAAPYHLASDLYVRGSLAEYWAFIWMPLILFFTHKIVNGQRLGVVGFAASYALLVMTHLPTTLIFSPLPIFYALCLASPGRKAISSGLVLVATMLGSGISFIYLWPAMTTQHFVFLERMSTGYFSYKNWLFFAKFSLWRDEKVLVLLTMLNEAGIACCTYLITHVKANIATTRLNAFWFAVSGVGVLMMTVLSAPLWVVFSVLQRIQFPWRFNSVVSLAITALLALAISALKTRDWAVFKITKLLAVVLILSWIPATGWAVWQAYPFHNTDQEEINYKQKEIAQNREVPEYYPRWNRTMADLNWETSIDETEWDAQLNSRFESVIQRIGESGGSLAKVKIVNGTGQASINSWKTGEIRLEANTTTGMELNVSQFYFPNWTARLQSEPSNLMIQPSQPDGLISLFIPKGDHQVLIQLERSSAEKVGFMISLISIAITLAFLAAKRRYQILPKSNVDKN